MRFAWLMAAIAALWALPAGAVTLSKFYLTGTITEQTNAGDHPVPFGVGSTITLEAMADLSQAGTWGDTGYKIVGFYDNPTFKITIGGNQIGYRDEINDGTNFFIDYISGAHAAAPAVLFRDGKIAGVFGYFAPDGNIPGFIGGTFGSGYKDFCNWPEPEICTSYSLYLSDTFSITNENLYRNHYRGPAFTGVWNFEQSIAPVPEPVSWALLILGIGLAGAAMRKHRAHPSVRRATHALAA